MYFAVLGPLRVRSADGADVTPPGRVLREVLALLLVYANRPVPVDTLTEVVWPVDSSGRTQAKLQLAVHRLRALLDSPERIGYDAGGYRIRVAEHEYDVARLDAAAARLLVEELPPAEVVEVARDALALWRGETVLEGLDRTVAAPEVARIAARRRWLVETWCEAEIARGHAAVVLPDLEALVAAEPLHERHAVLLMRALRASGRAADALTIYTRTRSVLADELGLDPGPDLEREQARALAGDLAVGAVPDDGRVPAQLPPRPPGLTGRDDDLAALDDAVSAPGPRIVVVTGTAGVGKTATTLTWAHRHRGDFTDGQIFLDLRGFSGDPPVPPDEALAVLLRSLGIEPASIPSGTAERSALFRSLVADRSVLVVLDNARSVDQVRPLLPGGPACAVLVTSRAALPGLGAREGARVVDLSPLAEAASYSLLVDLVGDGATRDPDAVRALARWCGHLPLALRIAAQQVATHPARSVTDVVAELADDRDRLDLLDVDDGPGTDIRAVLSWSYDALPAEAARLFRMLGVLPGADADEAALAALSGTEPRALRRHLSTLVRAHLVDSDAEGRYQLHDVLRAYAAELAHDLDDAEERAEARRRLLAAYARAAAAGREDPHAVDAWLAREGGNVIAAVEEAGVASAADVAALADACGHILRVSGRRTEGRRLHTRQLELALATDDLAGEDTARMALGNLAMADGDWAAAEAAYRAVIELSDRRGDRLRWAAATGNLGGLATCRGDLQQAEELLTGAIEVDLDRGNSWGATIDLCRLGDCRLLAGDPDGARRLFEQALRLCDESGVDVARGEALVGLADAAIALGEPGRAEELAVAALELAHAGSEDEPLATSALAAVRVAQGRRAEGEELIAAAVRGARQLGTVDVTMSVLRRYVVPAGPHEAGALRKEAIAFAEEHGFHGVAAELGATSAGGLSDSGPVPRRT